MSALNELRNVVEAMSDLKQAVDKEKEIPEKLRTEIVKLCKQLLSALGEGGGYGYPQPKSKKDYGESGAGHYFGR